VSAAVRPDRRSDLIFRQVDDEVCVYDPIRDRITLLNTTSALILDLCDGTRTWEQIAAEVAEAFPVAREVVARDVETMRVQFVRAGLLRRAVDG
jgi:coenzyme PQQ synthesis protein D (PqqD)